MNQFFMALFGLASLFLAYSKNPAWQKLSPIIGLAGQPAWFWFAWQSQAWGLGTLVLAYTLVYANGIYVQWRRA